MIRTLSAFATLLGVSLLSACGVRFALGAAAGEGFDEASLAGRERSAGDSGDVEVAFERFADTECFQLVAFDHRPLLSASGSSVSRHVSLSRKASGLPRRSHADPRTPGPICRVRRDAVTTLRQRITRSLPGRNFSLAPAAVGPPVVLTAPGWRLAPRWRDARGGFACVVAAFGSGARRAW